MSCWQVQSHLAHSVPRSSNKEAEWAESLSETNLQSFLKAPQFYDFLLQAYTWYWLLGEADALTIFKDSPTFRRALFSRAIMLRDEISYNTSLKEVGVYVKPALIPSRDQAREELIQFKHCSFPTSCNAQIITH